MKKNESKKVFTESIQTTVIKGFTDDEWKDLVKDFKKVMISQNPEYNVSGYSLGSKSSKFVKEDIPRLLNDAFLILPLNNPDGWHLDDLNCGVKNLYIFSDIFRDRLINDMMLKQHTSPHPPPSKLLLLPPTPVSSPQQQTTYNTFTIIDDDDEIKNTPVKKRQSYNEESEEEEEEESVEEEKNSQQKYKKLRVVAYDSIGDLVQTFVHTQVQSSNDVNLSRYEVWMRFSHWAMLKGEYVSEKEFYTSFENLYPNNWTQKNNKKYYQNFCIKMRHAPRYPPR
jgi:hypothetical protein